MLPLAILAASHFAVIPALLVCQRVRKNTARVIKYEHKFDIYGNERFWWLVDHPEYSSTRIMLHEIGKTTLNRQGLQWEIYISTCWSLESVQAESISKTYYYAASEKLKAMEDIEDFVFRGRWPA